MTSGQEQGRGDQDEHPGGGLSGGERWGGREHWDAEEQLSGLFEISHVATIIWDPANSKFVDVNQAALELYQYTREDFLAMDIARLFPASAQFRRMAVGADPTRTITDEAAQHVRSDGRVLAVMVRAWATMLGGRVVRVVQVREQGLEATAAVAAGLAPTQVVETVLAAMWKQDPYTVSHQLRVASLVEEITRILGMGPWEAEGVVVAAKLHDIGLLGLPTEILNFPGRLSAAAFNLVKDHPRAGADVLAQADWPWPVSRMVLEHHEREDGSGYPYGLTGPNILLGSKIIAVADVVEAISSHRPYRPALGTAVAVDALRAGSGRSFDLEVVDACIRLLTKEVFLFTNPEGY